jgi:predicted small secreted protein
MKNTTAIVLSCVLLVLATFVISGCCNLPEGFQKDSRPGMTSQDIADRNGRVLETDRQQFLDDFDHFWLLERPDRLSMLRQQ